MSDKTFPMRHVPRQSIHVHPALSQSDNGDSILYLFGISPTLERLSGCLRQGIRLGVPFSLTII